MWTHRSSARLLVGTLIPAGADALYTAINRLLADGHAIFRVMETGDVWINHADINRADLTALADEIHLPTMESTEAPAATAQIEAQRVGLIKPSVASMDEGWTRWVLEQYDFPMINLANEQIRSGEFTDTVDVMLFPDASAGVISKGKPGDSYRGRVVLIGFRAQHRGQPLRTFKLLFNAHYNAGS